MSPMSALTSPMNISALTSPLASLSSPFVHPSVRVTNNGTEVARLCRQTSEELLFGDSPPASPFSLISPATQQPTKVFVWGSGISPDLTGFIEQKTLMKKNDPRSKSKNGSPSTLTGSLPGKGKHCPPAPDRNSRKGPPLRRKNSLWEDKVLRHFSANQDTGMISSINFVNWKRLGEGGFCEVFQAMDASTGQIFAIKKAKMQYRGRKDREQHLKEVEVAGRLPPHPNVLRYFQAWQEDGLFHLAIECCDGNLDLLVKEGVELQGPMLPESFLVNVCRQIARALRHIHRAKVLHLDLKPENVLVKSNEGLLKLGDFGHSMSKKEWRDGAEGDRTYMAPELLEAEAMPTEAADIFSLGMLLFELATGRDLPEKGPLWQRLRDGSPRTSQFLAAKSQTSKPFQDILMSCMNPNPKLRPNAVTILEQLNAFPDVGLFVALGISKATNVQSDMDSSASRRLGLSIQVPTFKRGVPGPDSPCTTPLASNSQDHSSFSFLPGQSATSGLVSPTATTQGTLTQPKRTERRALARIPNSVVNTMPTKDHVDPISKQNIGNGESPMSWERSESSMIDD